MISCSFAEYIFVVSLVGMWNDTSYRAFNAPKPNFMSRTISAKEYFDQIMNDSYSFLYSYSYSYLVGDINIDGRIGIADLLLIYDFILGDLTPNDMQYFLADYDSNGLVNILDALILINVILNNN